eukprot:9140443-Pyramimonas_sp.AAC.1
MKGKKFSGGALGQPGRQALRHNIDKVGWEIGVSKQQVKAAAELKPALAAKFPNNPQHNVAQLGRGLRCRERQGRDNSPA